MLDFRKLGEDISVLKGCFDGISMPFCEFSLGEKYLWRDAFVVDYALTDGGECILKESSEVYGYQDAFYYPKSEDSLKRIEEYAKNQDKPLTFCYLTEEEVEKLRAIYPVVYATYDRDTSDYFYLAEDFKGFRGKKFSGQRNHINKFFRTYPTACFRRVDVMDAHSIRDFCNRYRASLAEVTTLETEELSKIDGFVANMDRCNVLGGAMWLDGEIIAFSLGEVVGDTLVVHVEKALRSYPGLYPALASAFVREYATDGVVYVNREEDCGVEGLRISKMQYHPIAIKHKYLVEVETAYSLLDEHIELETDRLTLSEIRESDKQRYCELWLDEQVNRYYGYDYREDLGDNAPTADYFFCFQQGLKDRREEYALGVRVDGVLIGDVVIYNTNYRGEVEIGFRFFRDHQGRGYATEATSCVLRYLKDRGIKKVVARHHHDNLPSRKLIEKLGFTHTHDGEDKRFYALIF